MSRVGQGVSRPLQERGRITGQPQGPHRAGMHGQVRSVTLAGSASPFAGRITCCTRSRARSASGSRLSEACIPSKGLVVVSLAEPLGTCSRRGALAPGAWAMVRRIRQ